MVYPGRALEPQLLPACPSLAGCQEVRHGVPWKGTGTPASSCLSCLGCQEVSSAPPSAPPMMRYTQAQAMKSTDQTHIHINHQGSRLAHIQKETKHQRTDKHPGTFPSCPKRQGLPSSRRGNEGCLAFYSQALHP